MKDCILEDPLQVSTVLTVDNIPRLKQLGVFDRLIGKWPIGNTSIEEVTKSVTRAVEDPQSIVRMTYKYSHDHPDSDGQVSADLISFTIHSSANQAKCVDILKQFCT